MRRPHLSAAWALLPVHQALNNHNLSNSSNSSAKLCELSVRGEKQKTKKPWGN